ncbi:hypothetical protein EJB05_17218, partial [Eragrostis curvula]
MIHNLHSVSYKKYGYHVNMDIWQFSRRVDFWNIKPEDMDGSWDFTASISGNEENKMEAMRSNTYSSCERLTLYATHRVLQTRDNWFHILAAAHIKYAKKIWLGREVLPYQRNKGDRCAKPYLIPKPEVIVVPRAKDDDCLIIASDGMWDVMSNEYACEVARLQILLWYKQNGNGADPDEGGEPMVKSDMNGAAQAAADFLVEKALENRSTDNITVTVIDLKPRRKIKVKS